MQQKENIAKKPDDRLTALFEMAHRDPELKAELLRNPQAVAEKYGVEFSEGEVQQLQNLGALTALTADIKYGRLYPRPPIFYPIHIWEINELLEIFKRLIPGPIFYPAPGPIFYPAPPDFQRFAVYAARGYHPEWITYPGDDPSGSGSGGGGSGKWGGVIPGPIFYPASLISFIRIRLEQILQVQTRFNR